MQSTTEYHVPSTDYAWQKGTTVPVTTQADVLQTTLMI